MRKRLTKAEKRHRFLIKRAIRDSKNTEKLLRKIYKRESKTRVRTGIFRT